MQSRAGRAAGVCMGDSQVTIKLTRDEALVLSHWLEKLPTAGTEETALLDAALCSTRAIVSSCRR